MGRGSSHLETAAQAPIASTLTALPPQPRRRSTSSASARVSASSPASASTSSSRTASASSSSAQRWCRPSPSASQSASSLSSGRSRVPSGPPAEASATAAPSTPQRERKRRALARRRRRVPRSRGRASSGAPSRPSCHHPQEVVGEAVDEVARRLRAARWRRDGAAPPRGRARPPGRAASRASPAAARGARARARGRRRPSPPSARVSSRSSPSIGAPRETKRRIRSGVKCGCSTISAPSARIALAVRLVQVRRPRVPEQDQRLLLHAERARVDLDRRGLREALGPALAVQPPQPGAQRRGAGGPDEPVPLVGRLQDAVEVGRPALGGVGAVLGRAERVVGDEQLRLGAVEALPRSARASCTRAPPSPRSAAPARASARSRSCPSPAGRSGRGSDAPSGSPPRAATPVSERRPWPARAWPRCRPSSGSSASGSGGAASSESTDGSFIRSAGRRRIASKSSCSP